MVAITSKSPWGTPESLALLHACRTQDDLERELATGFASLLPGVEVAFCLSQSSGKSFEVRFVIGGEVPLQPLQVCTRDAWQLPEEQRLGITFKQHLLGEVWLGVAPSIDVRAELAETLVHVATAMVNLALNSEARDATHEYCATLQALEEGIVLFQEHDEEAMMARLLSLASGMVEATAGALYVLAEVGKADSELVLMQALGMPYHLLESFVTEDGSPWPESLLAYSAKVIGRDEQGHFDGLADECAPGVLQDIVVLPLRYHGVQAGVCVLFNPKSGAAQAREYITRLQSFGQLAAALLHRLSLERLKENSISIGRELQIAATIQKRLVPTEAPPSERYEFAWSSLSAKNIGGDYVDVVPGDLDDLYTIVADASGHGINSALLMTSFRANYRGNVMWQDPPELAVKPQVVAYNKMDVPDSSDYWDEIQSGLRERGVLDEDVLSMSAVAQVGGDSVCM